MAGAAAGLVGDLWRAQGPAPPARGAETPQQPRLASTPPLRGPASPLCRAAGPPAPPPVPGSQHAAACSRRTRRPDLTCRRRPPRGARPSGSRAWARRCARRPARGATPRAPHAWRCSRWACGACRSCCRRARAACGGGWGGRTLGARTYARARSRVRTSHHRARARRRAGHVRADGAARVAAGHVVRRVQPRRRHRRADARGARGRARSRAKRRRRRRARACAAPGSRSAHAPAHAHPHPTPHPAAPPPRGARRSRRRCCRTLPRACGSRTAASSRRWVRAALRAGGAGGGRGERCVRPSAARERSQRAHGAR